MTMQFGDTLLWRGVQHHLRDGGPLLEAWQEKDRPKFEPMSTACWRGFMASWVVDDDGWLRVASVRTGDMLRKRPDGGLELTRGSDESLFILFPGHDGPVAATWFTGALETGYGEGMLGQPDQYDIVYPHYRIFHVEAGKVVQIEDHDRSSWEKRTAKRWE
jgi:hypothetical protein